MGSTNWGALLDTAEAEGFSTKVVDPGKYDAVVEATNVKTTQSGKPMVGVMFRITQAGPFEGATIWDNMTLTIDNPKAMKIWFTKWAALGVTADDFRAHPDVHSSLEPLSESTHGAEVNLNVTKRRDDEDKRNVWPNKRSGSAVTPATTSADAPPPAADPLAGA